MERAQRSSGGFSYTNALIAELDGETACMVLSYAITEAPTDNPDDLPAPIAPFVALEKLSVDTWFINALAVYGEKQNHGRWENSANSNALQETGLAEMVSPPAPQWV